MKRLLILIAALGIVLSASAESIWFKAFSGAYKYGNNDWSDWINCNIKILFNDDSIKVYSEEVQTYMHLYDLDNPSDDVYGFKMVDDEGIYCDIKFRFEDNGNLQMYIYYSNAAIVYNIKRIQ